MIVKISPVAYLVMSLLLIAFLPHFYLLLIFAIMTIVELIEYLGKLINKFIKNIEYIFPNIIMFLFYSAIIYTIVLELKFILSNI